MRRFVLPLAALVLSGALAAADSGQSIVSLNPEPEQRVEMLGTEGGEQRVEALDEEALQGITGQEPPSSGTRVLSTAGKIAGGVLAAGVSLGFMAASLLLF